MGSIGTTFWIQRFKMCYLFSDKIMNAKKMQAIKN